MIKTILKVFLGLFLILVILALGFLFLFNQTDPSRYKGFLTEHLKAQTGIDLQINGALDLKLFPLPHVSMEKIRLEAPLDAQHHFEMQADQFNIGVNIQSYLKQEIQIRNIHVQQAKLTFYQNKTPIETLSIDAGDLNIEQHKQGARFPKFKLTMPAGDLQGTLDINWTKKPLQIKGDIRSNALDLNQWRQAETAQSDHIIPQIALPFDWIEGIALDLSVDVVDLLINKTHMRDVKLQAHTKHKTMTVSNLSLGIYGGQVKGDLSLEKTGAKSGRLKTNLKGKDLSLERYYQADQSGHLMKGGLFDFSFQGHGIGENIREVLGNWKGRFVWQLGEATVYNQAIQSNLTDVVFGFVSFLNPLAQKEQNTEIKCAAMNFDIEKGIAHADKKVGIETKRFNVLGSGQVNLNNEQIQFEISLEKKGGISLPFTDFDQYVALTGTLADPKLQVNPKGLIEGGASLFSAISTAGMSLIAEQLFEVLEHVESPCQAALK